jgi:hypothetical protein
MAYMTSNGLIVGIYGTGNSITPAAITGTNNNYSPTGLTSNTTIWQDLSAAATLTGLAAGVDGSEVTIVNISTTAANIITISHQSGSSTAANRFILPNATSWYIVNGGSATFKYNAAQSRWYMLRYTGNKLPSLTLDDGLVGTPSLNFASGSNYGLFKSGNYVVVAVGGSDYHYLGAEYVANTAVPIEGRNNFRLTNDTSAALGADANDYAGPTGGANSPIWYITPDAARTLTGIVAKSDGTFLWIKNAATTAGRNIVLANESVSSAAANRILTTNALGTTIPPGGMAMLVYSTAVSRWHAGLMG